jgi:adenosine deaminase
VREPRIEYSRDRRGDRRDSTGPRGHAGQLRLRVLDRRSHVGERLKGCLRHTPASLREGNGQGKVGLVGICGRCGVLVSRGLQGTRVVVSSRHRDGTRGRQQPTGGVDPDGKRLELAWPGLHGCQLLVRGIERPKGGGRIRSVQRGQRDAQRLQGCLGGTTHGTEGVGSVHGVGKLRGRRANRPGIDHQLGRNHLRLKDGELARNAPQRIRCPQHQGVTIGQGIRRGGQVRAGLLVARHGEARTDASLAQRVVEDHCQRIERVRCLGTRGRQRRPGRGSCSRVGEERISRALAQDRTQGNRGDQPGDEGLSRPQGGCGPGEAAYHATVPATGPGPAGGAEKDDVAGSGSALAGEIAALPKAELHLHLDGGMRPTTAVALARDAGMPLDLVAARQRMIAPARCRNQAELLTYFDLPIRLLQTGAALRRTARELVEDLAADGITYAEIRWAPRLHLDGGLGVGAVIDAVATGVAEAGAALDAAAPVIGLIVTAMRSHPPAANVLLAREAAGFGPPVVGFDLAGPEAEWPAPPHAAAFVAAAEGGLSLTAHAGEVPGPQRIREALALGAVRIAHGVTAIEDPELVAELRDRGVTLDLCPTSNVQSAIVAELASHPLARLHRAGVSVTCSTDDRVVSDTTLTAELARTADALALTRVELAAVAVNAFRRGFMPNAQRAVVTAAANDAWAGWAATSTLLS